MRNKDQIGQNSHRILEPLPKFYIWQTFTKGPEVFPQAKYDISPHGVVFTSGGKHVSRKHDAHGMLFHREDRINPIRNTDEVLLQE